jgi:CRP-like cAMP-binding protein
VHAGSGAAPVVGGLATAPSVKDWCDPLALGYDLFSVELEIRIQQLARAKIFSGLTDDGLRLLAAIAEESSHAEGSLIFEHGAMGDRLFLILDGRVRIRRLVAGMGEEALAVLNAGDVFGEMALLDEAPRSADAVAHEPCALLSIGKDAFEDLLFLHKDLAYEVLWNVIRTLIRRLRATNDKLTFLSITDRF